MTERWTTGRATRAAFVALLLLAAPSRADAPPQDATDKAVAAGIRYLLSKQDAKGAIHDVGGVETATTSLAVLALAAAGHQPGDESPEGRAMQRGLAFVLGAERQDGSGYFGARDGSNMYGHGITTLMLAEMLGMGADAAQDEQIRKRCRSGVDLILRAQGVKKQDSHQGGWRYSPEANDSDLSVTVWQLMALRAAKNAGFDVPSAAIAAAVKYIKGSYTSSNKAQAGGFSYQPRAGGPAFASTAQGLLALQACGEYDAPEVKGAADWLRANSKQRDGGWFYYGMYYFAQGMHQRGGEHAAEARKVVEDTLTRKQEAPGSWPVSQGENQGGRVYATSMSILSLAVKYHLLPVYQR